MTSKEISPELKEFIDQVIVPALVRECLKEQQSQNPPALPATPLTSESNKESV